MSWDWDKLKQQQQGRGGGVPPPMDEILDKVKKFKMPGGGPLVILAIVVLFIASSTFYTVKQDEVGIVQLFGRYVRTSQPGLNFKLPIGIEKVTKVNVKNIQTEEFGFSSARLDSRSRFKSDGDNTNVSLMLTGDLNVPWCPGSFNTGLKILTIIYSKFAMFAGS
jgi:membrane protease subunit HflK